MPLLMALEMVDLAFPVALAAVPIVYMAGLLVVRCVFPATVAENTPGQILALRSFHRFCDWAGPFFWPYSGLNDFPAHTPPACSASPPPRARQSKARCGSPNTQKGRLRHAVAQCRDFGARRLRVHKALFDPSPFWAVCVFLVVFVILSLTGSSFGGIWFHTSRQLPKPCTATAATTVGHPLLVVPSQGFWFPVGAFHFNVSEPAGTIELLPQTAISSVGRSLIITL